MPKAGITKEEYDRMRSLPISEKVKLLAKFKKEVKNGYNKNAFWLPLFTIEIYKAHGLGTLEESAFVYLDNFIFSYDYIPLGGDKAGYIIDFRSFLSDILDFYKDDIENQIKILNEIKDLKKIYDSIKKDIFEISKNILLFYIDRDGINKENIEDLKKYARIAYNTKVPSKEISFYLGYIEESSNSKDPSKVYDYFEEASKLGSLKAEAEIILMLKDKTNPLYNINEAIERLDKIEITEEIKDYLSDLGDIYKLDQNKTNDERALQFYKAGVEYGNINSYARYGDCLLFGLYGERKSPSKALEYYQKAKDAGLNVDYEMHCYNLEVSGNNEFRSYALNLIDKYEKADWFNQIEKDLKGEFGGNWHKLEESSRRFLSTGIYTYVVFFSSGKDAFKNIDFSGSVITMIKALENIFCDYFFTGYINYLKANNIPPWYVKESHVTYSDGGFYMNPLSKDSFTFGDVIYIFWDGVNNFNSHKAHFGYKNYHMCQYFVNYCSSIFRDDAFDQNNRYAQIEKYLFGLYSDVINIIDMRNRAAHKDIVYCKDAEICGNYLLKDQSIIINFFNKLKTI